MAAKKTTGSSAPKKKAAARKKAAKKAAAAPKKKASAKKPAAKRAAPSDPPAKPEPKVDSPKTPEGAGMSTEVSLGHVFALRPRVNTSFRQNDLAEAKRALKDEVYPDIASAARAVAEEALSLTRGAASERPRKHRRR